MKKKKYLFLAFYKNLKDNNIVYFNEWANNMDEALSAIKESSFDIKIPELVEYHKDKEFPFILCKSKIFWKWKDMKLLKVMKFTTNDLIEKAVKTIYAEYRK